MLSRPWSSTGSGQVFARQRRRRRKRRETSFLDDHSVMQNSRNGVSEDFNAPVGEVSDVGRSQERTLPAPVETS